MRGPCATCTLPQRPHRHRPGASIECPRPPSFTETTRTATLATDFGVEHWVVEYSDTKGNAPRGLRISIVVSTGHVEISTFP